VSRTDIENTLAEMRKTGNTAEVIASANARLRVARQWRPRLQQLIDDTDKTLRKYGVETPAIEPQF
jgi:Holliday junction resolvasome RuvABC endonuclease subunit